MFSSLLKIAIVEIVVFVTKVERALLLCAIPEDIDVPVVDERALLLEYSLDRVAAPIGVHAREIRRVVDDLLLGDTLALDRRHGACVNIAERPTEIRLADDEGKFPRIAVLRFC